MSEDALAVYLDRVVISLAYIDEWALCLRKISRSKHSGMGGWREGRRTYSRHLYEDLRNTGNDRWVLLPGRPYRLLLANGNLTGGWNESKTDWTSWRRRKRHRELDCGRA